MFRRSIPISLLFALAACTSNEGNNNPPPGRTDSGTPPIDMDSGVIDPPGPDGGVVVREFPESGKALVRFKRNERLRNDFAQALGLNPNDVCKEFGLYSCTEMVHTIALGGVEPYIIGIREALDFTTITTPMAVERVALAGCEQRVTTDFGDPAGALIFKNLGVDANGAIPDLAAAGVSETIDTLYRRVLQRHARDTEIEHLKQLYRDVEATNEPGPARDWAILSCFSVMTTMEALFY